MKRLFLLIPVLALSLLANATVININTSTSNALRTALNSANTGDIIVMAAGTYNESGDYLAFTGKELTVRAAEGAEVIIKTVCPVRLKEGAKAEFINVKFDCSTIGSYDYVIVAADDTDNKRVVLTGCEFYGWDKNKAMIEATSSRRLAAITIDKCYFHDCMKSVVFVENTGSIALSITNSTFANISTNTESFSAGVIDSRATSGSFLVDHCTFYNCKVINTDYGTIGRVATPGAVVSNCIFAMPESTADLRAIRDVATANNCLTYNYTKDSNWGIHSSVTKNNCIQLKDPLFTDAANGDFSLAGDWTDMTISPARYAGTDGSHLGDPRWHSAETLPSTSFASDYDLLGTNAMLSGRIELNASNKIHFTHNADVADGTAKWKLHVGKSCIVSALVDVESGCTVGRLLTLTVKDADGNTVATLTQPSATYNDADIDLGQIAFSEDGDYTLILTNSLVNSTVVLEKITLSYIGGDVQAMPGTTDIDDAWFSSNGTRTAGEYISIPDGQQDEGWVKWNVAFASAGNFNVTVNIDNTNGHNYTVALYRSESDESPITIGEGGQKSDIGTAALGAMEVPAGNYIMKVTNATKWSDAKLKSVTFAYAGGGVIEFGKSTPASLLANADAIVSDDWSIEGGKITHAESKATTGWAKWNVDCADYGNYNVTVNISSDNGHGMRVQIFEDESESAIYTLDEASSTKYAEGDLALDLGNITLSNREYVVKITNTMSSSHAEIASIVITYLNGARATLPASCTFADLMLSTKAHVTDGNLWFNTIGDSNPVGQWAKWNIKAASAGTFLFTMNVSSTNGQSYKISILDMEENELDAFESGSVGSGDKTIKHYFNLAAGNYIVKLENTYSWSQGHIASLVVTQPSLITIDEAATSNSVITGHYRDGNHDIKIIRTITPNMYNTICLPFDVSSSQLPVIFGSDVELLQMASATLSDDVLDLNFDAATSIYRGTPYLIKTTKTVSNPVFTDVEIKEETGQSTVCDNADFIGNFIKGTIPAGEDNLFLGQNNLLYFSESTTTIKGMRAYFEVKNSSGTPIRHARIVEQSEVVTELELINGEWQDIKSANGTIKTIENGQLILIRDGKRYNVMGIRF